MRTLFLTLAIFSGSALYAVEASHVKSTDPWTPLAPKGAPMAGFVQLENTTDKPIKIANAASRDFATVEIHETVKSNGSMSMRKATPVIPAGKTIELAPGGMHLMLMQPTRTFKAGDTFTVTLETGDHKKLDLTFHVKDKR